MTRVMIIYPESAMEMSGEYLSMSPPLFPQIMTKITECKALIGTVSVPQTSKSLILEKWDKTVCNSGKIKHCTQTNETTFMCHNSFIHL